MFQAASYPDKINIEQRLRYAAVTKQSLNKHLYSIEVNHFLYNFLLMHNLIQDFAKNTLGRDFFVGDLHGCYRLLLQQLQDVGFDRQRDRLFCVGDICDRGPDSVACLHLATRSDFPLFSVKGNHEAMLIDAAYDETSPTAKAWKSPFNGGQWANEQPQQLRQLASTLTNWPLVIRIATDSGDIIVVHADLPVNDIGDLPAALSTPSARSHCLWSRERMLRATTPPITGVAAVVVGHTPFEDAPHCVANIVDIDAGAFYNQRLLLLSSNQILSLVGAHSGDSLH